MAGEIPRTSTAVLEFQQASADGDFGLAISDGTMNIAGLSRTSGKNVVKCKLTANVASSSMANAGMTPNNASGSLGLEATGLSLLGNGITENSANNNHYGVGVQPGIGAGVAQTLSVWLARGSGTHNRYVRVQVGNNYPLSVGGYWTDVDLQAGTASGPSASGTGTATSVSITALGAGWLVKLTGSVSGAITPTVALSACSASGTLTYTGDSTQCFIHDHLNLVSASSISDTTFNVDTDTGWLNGDAVCVAATTRTPADCEIYPLNANAGASSFTSALSPFGNGVISTHHGISPVQAEIGLLTRNVKIRSTSATLMSYVYCTALATVTASWAEFYYIGMGSANKRGLEIDGGATTNPKSFTYCSIHDCDIGGVYCNASGVTSLNLTMSNCVMWTNYGTTVFVTIAGTITNPDWTFDGNLVMRSSNYAFSLFDVGGTFTNNTVVGTTSAAFGAINMAESSATLGTFSGNTSHSNTGPGITFATASLSGTIGDFTAWRNTTVGVYYSSGNSIASSLVFSNLVLFGNTSTNFLLNANSTVNIVNGTIAGDTTFSTATGISMGVAGIVHYNVSSLDMSGVGGIFAPHTTNDVATSASPTEVQGFFNNCKFGAPSLFSSKSTWTGLSYLGFQKYNQSAGDHRTEMTYGQIKTDTTVYNTVSPSMRMTPNNASNKLESALPGKGILVPVTSGSTVTARVAIRKDADYNGRQPRLVSRANAAIGIVADAVLAACTDVTTAGSLTPASLAGLVGWWDASVAGSFSLTGSNINSVADQSGAGNTMNWTGFAKPVYNAVGFNTSYPAIMLDTAIGSALQVTPFAMGTGNTLTIWYVGTMPGVTSNSFGRVLAYAKPAANDFDNVGSWNLSAGSILGSTIAIQRNSIAATMSAVSVPPAGHRVIATINSSGVMVVYVDGVALAQATVPGNWVSAGTLSIGRQQPGNSSYLTAPIAECGIATGYSDAATVMQLDNYLRAKWGLPGSFIPTTGTGVWNTITGTTVAVTDDGVVEFIVDCDGVSGFINIDDLAFGATTNDVKYWSNGLLGPSVQGVIGRVITVQRGTPF